MVFTEEDKASVKNLYLVKDLQTTETCERIPLETAENGSGRARTMHNERQDGLKGCVLVKGRHFEHIRCDAIIVKQITFTYGVLDCLKCSLNFIT